MCSLTPTEFSLGPLYQPLFFLFSLQLADYVTTDLFALNALCAAFACGMYGLGDTG